MQYFGLVLTAKALLYAINGGIDEIYQTRLLVITFRLSQVLGGTQVLDYDTVLESFKVMDKLAKSMSTQ